MGKVEGVKLKPPNEKNVREIFSDRGGKGEKVDLL